VSKLAEKLTQVDVKWMLVVRLELYKIVVYK